MSKKEAILLSLLVVVFIGGFYYYMQYVFKPAQNKPTELLATAITGTVPAHATEIQEWTMPTALKEISSNVLLDDVHMACVQDNDGIIYIYNLKNKTVEDQIHFAGGGDYEGLTIVKDRFYVLRSDGFLFEVQPQKGSKPTVKTYDLPLKLVNETESLCYDSKHNRLLMAVKEKDLHDKDRKGVYGFDLATNQMSTNAVFYIDAKLNNNGDEDKGGKGKKKKKSKSEIKPSAIGIHPKTGDIYILDGPSSRLLITDEKGNTKDLIQLDKKTLPQPEGLCFNANGELFVSSEGGKNGEGVIVKLSY